MARPSPRTTFLFSVRTSAPEVHEPVMEPKNYSERTDSKFCTKLPGKAANRHASSVIRADAEAKDMDGRDCGSGREAGVGRNKSEWSRKAKGTVRTSLGPPPV